MRLNPLYIILYTLTISVSIILGLIVFQKEKQKTINLLFAGYVVVLTFWIICNFFADSLTHPDAVLFWTKMGLVGPILVGPIFLHFSYIFPTGKNQWQRIIPIWIIPIIAVALTPTDLNIKSIQIEPWGTSYQPGILYIISSLMILIYMIWGTINLYRKKKSSTSSVQAQLQLIGIGSITSLIISLITGAILPLLGESRLAILAPSSTLILFGAIGYAIIKHRFLDISLLIFRTVSFTLVITLAAALYALVIFNLPLLIPINNNQVISVIFAIILALTFHPLKQSIENLTKNIFFKQPYSSTRLLERLGELLRSTLSLHTLMKSVLSELQITMHPSSAAFHIYFNGEIKREGYGTEKKLKQEDFFELKKFTENNEVVVINEIEEGPIKNFLRKIGYSAVIPLRVKEQHHGFLLIGEKLSGNDFSKQDVEVLEILSPQLSLAFQNAKSYEEISQFNETLKQEIEKATSSLKQANRELKHLDKLKDEFVFIATHELKNPVTAMRGYLSLLQEGSFGQIPNQMKDAFNQLQASNQQLVELVNDLLQIARSEAKTLSIQTQPVDLTPIIESITQSLKPISDQKGLTIAYSFQADLPQVMADAQRVKEITNNLISNAIKYSDAGTITISHEIEDGLLITHVADQGVGISHEDQTKLFTRFYRVEEEAAKGIPGTGLGLFIVKQLLEKMGGSIWLKSAKGQGSTFSFSLPLA